MFAVFHLQGESIGGLVTCNLGNLAAGEAVAVTITTQVIDYAPAGLPLTMTNQVAAFSGGLWDEDFSNVILQNCHARVNGLPPTHASVQAAVDAAAPGDAVWIAGVCTGASLSNGSRRQVYVNKNLALRGGYNDDFSAWNPSAQATTLDALAQGQVLTVIGPAQVTVEALQLTGGDATGQGGLEQGFADAGGGVYAIDATLILSGCQVSGNLASTNFDGFGGGIAVTTDARMRFERLMGFSPLARPAIAPVQNDVGKVSGSKTLKSNRAGQRPALS